MGLMNRVLSVLRAGFRLVALQWVELRGDAGPGVARPHPASDNNSGTLLFEAPANTKLCEVSHTPILYFTDDCHLCRQISINELITNRLAKAQISLMHSKKTGFN